MFYKSILNVVGVVAVIAMVMFVGCVAPELDEEGNPVNGGNGGGPGSSRENPKTVTVGYDDSHTVSRDGEYWFKFVGTGDIVIFETEGNVVDTYMNIECGNWICPRDDNSGEGSNALLSQDTKSGETYYIKVTPQSGTSGMFTFVVKAVSPVNIRTNPIPITVGYSSSFNISGGQYWYRLQGTGNGVVFETESNVVNTTIELYIGDNTGRILFDKNRISFSTLSGTTYYINITSSNSGTYTFSVRNGIGDGSSKEYAIPTTVGYSSSHTISRDGEHWFSFTGTGNTVIFETEGNVVDTYMNIECGNWICPRDDNSGEGSNALLSQDTKSGETYFIKVTPQSGTSGSYTFVVK